MDKLYRVTEFAERIGKSASTLRRWGREGKLPAKRRASGHRYYDESDVRKALELGKKKTVVYCRVSSRSQLPDLESQVEAMRQFCFSGSIAVDEWIEEVGGGMNFKRKKFLSIMDRIEHGEISKLIIAHRDRLVRFGFDFFEIFAQKQGCEMVVANQEQLSPQQEMVEDLMAIVHCFSSRLSGLRSYKGKIKEALESDV